MNVEAFKNLIDNYKSIDLVDIEREWDENENSAYCVMQNLTGFGSCSSCSLCKAAGTKTGYGGSNWKQTCNCENCLYYLVNPNSDLPPCCDDTYNAMGDAETPEQLYDAIRDRINYMKEILEIYNGVIE